MSLRLGAVKSCRDYRSKAECSILAKGKNAKKTANGKHAKRFPFWREREDRQPLAGGGK